MIPSDKDNSAGNIDTFNYSDISNALSDFKSRSNLKNARISVKNRIKDGDIFKVIVSYMDEYPIKAGNNNEEIYVSVPFDARLSINDKNQLTDFEIIGPDLTTIDLIRERLTAGMNKGQIQFLNENGIDNERTDLKDSRDFFIHKDKNGKNHLKRSHFT